MNGWKKGYLVQTAVVFSLIVGEAGRAGETSPENADNQPLSIEDWFAHGRYEAAFTSGALFSPVGPTRGRPTINYTITELQFGYMLGNARGAGWLRGNFELA